jgi:hypothetical protein
MLVVHRNDTRALSENSVGGRARSLPSYNYTYKFKTMAPNLLNCHRLHCRRQPASVFKEYAKWQRRTQTHGNEGNWITLVLLQEHAHEESSSSSICDVFRVGCLFRVLTHSQGYQHIVIAQQTNVIDSTFLSVTPCSQLVTQFQKKVCHPYVHM